MKAKPLGLRYQQFSWTDSDRRWKRGYDEDARAFGSWLDTRNFVSWMVSVAQSAKAEKQVVGSGLLGLVSVIVRSTSNFLPIEVRQSVQ